MWRCVWSDVVAMKFSVSSRHNDNRLFCSVPIKSSKPYVLYDTVLVFFPAPTIAMRKVSVCLSVKRVDCDNTEVRSVQIFYTIRKII